MAVTIVKREDLAGRKLAVALVRDLFGAGRAGYVREYSAAEIATWRTASRTFDDEGNVRIDSDALQARQCQACLITGPEPDAQPLYGAGEIDAMLAEVPPGVQQRVVLLADRLAGYPIQPTMLGAFELVGATSNSGASTGSEGSRRRSTSR